MKKALEPIFKDEVNTMIKSIFEVKYEEGVAVGEARAVVKYLKARFIRVPKSISDRVLEICDTDILDSLTELSAKCPSLKEFEKALR